MALQVRIRAAVQPSEDPARVEKAIRNLFPNARIERTPDHVEASSDTLQDLRNTIWRQRILDASRRSLLRSLDPEGTHAKFRLNKQAAFKGRVSFSDGLTSPLGDVEVDVEGPGLEALFKEIAPMTIHGHPVSEERAEKELEKRRTAKAKRVATPEKAALEKEVVEEDWDEDLDEALQGIDPDVVSKEPEDDEEGEDAP